MAVLKNVRTNKALTSAIQAVAAREQLTPRAALLLLIRRGAERYAVELYRDGKVTMGQAAILANRTPRDMIEVIHEHGVRGNLTAEDVMESIESIRRLRREGSL
jgi:predicted HTH domain antitoxin